MEPFDAKIHREKCNWSSKEKLFPHYFSPQRPGASKVKNALVWKSQDSLWSSSNSERFPWEGMSHKAQGRSSGSANEATHEPAAPGGLLKHKGAHDAQSPVKCCIFQVFGLLYCLGKSSRLKALEVFHYKHNSERTLGVLFSNAFF